MQWAGPDQLTACHTNSFNKKIIYFDLWTENLRDSAIVEHSHKYGAIFWDVLPVKSLRSVLNGLDNKWVNTNTTAEIEYLSMQTRKLTFFWHWILQAIFSNLLANEKSFQPIVSSDVDNSSIDRTLTFTMLNYPVHARIHFCYSIAKMMKI